MCWYFNLQLFWIGHQHVTVNRSQEHSTGTLFNSSSVLVVIDSTPEKKYGAPSCPHDKGTGALLISGERNWCNTVFRRKELVHNCSEEKETCALLFLGEGNRCATLMRRRKLVLNCFQEKGTGALLFSGEGSRCSTLLTF